MSKFKLILLAILVNQVACAPDPIDFSVPKSVGEEDSAEIVEGKLVGDFNNDGVVNSVDLDLYKKKFNYIVYPPGDYNQDGVVDSADLVVYNSGSLAADGNANGKIDPGDLQVFTDNMNLGAVSHNAGDLDGDLDVDMDDFLEWRQRQIEVLKKSQAK